MLAVAKRVNPACWLPTPGLALRCGLLPGCGLGIIGNLLGYLLDPVAALIVGLMILKMGWEFGWGSAARPDGQSGDDDEVEGIRATILGTQGCVAATICARAKWATC
jgi:divalent metal cation (Fe/Co/Zn/Cd) transporter